MSKPRITAGDRVIEVNGGRDPISADVTKVSKDGKRMLIKFWGRGLREGKLTSQWVDAGGWRVHSPGACKQCGKTPHRVSGGMRRCNWCGWPTGGLAAVLAPLIGGEM